MSQVVVTQCGVRRDAHQMAPRPSRLISELLDVNHDAWHVSRNNAKWTFYREIGEEGRNLPFGSIVLTSEPGMPYSFDFLSARGKRSLLNSYGSEVPHLAQTLIDRERIVALFTKLAYHLDTPSWDHNLSFSGVVVRERRVQLRSTASVFSRLAGDAKDRVVVSPSGMTRTLSGHGSPGFVVSEHEGHSPLVQCSIVYPRPIAATFFSSRLREGLHSITHRLVSMVVEHNRSVSGVREGERWD